MDVSFVYYNLWYAVFIFKCDVEGLGIGFAEILAKNFKKKMNLFEFCPKFPKYRIYQQVPKCFFYQ